MKNITVSVDDLTYKRARLFAAAHETSVSALVKKHLDSLIETDAIDPWKKRRDRLNAAFDGIEGKTRRTIKDFNRSDLYEERLKLR